ncbi:MAG TPA: helix-hairpin-helix domain-containing protein [Patescibacteria group bacterium]|nr:helix-hairpin-helix domain-containing protein [Patescibacteria group bacterium]
MQKFFDDNQKLIIFLLLGLILIGFGVLFYKTDIFSSNDKVEVLNNVTEPQDDKSEIVVEIAGAVIKPGVYKLSFGSRIDDLLIISGGLSQDANRSWVEKNINRAAKLIDGQKLYIYHSDEISAKDSGGIKLDQGVLGINDGGHININTSSQKELESLVGIGPVYAQNIIEHRPYSTLEELVTKGVVSQKVFDKIKNEITN